MAGLDTFFTTAPAAARGARQGLTDIRNTLADVEAMDQQYRNMDERRLLQQGLTVPPAAQLAEARVGLELPVSPLDASRPLPPSGLTTYVVPEPPPPAAATTNTQQIAPNLPVVGLLTRPKTGEATPETLKAFEQATAIAPVKAAEFKPGIGPFAGKQFNFLSDGPSLVNPLLNAEGKINEGAYTATRNELERLTNDAKTRMQKAGPLAGNEELFYYKNQLDYLDTTFKALKKQNKVVSVAEAPVKQSKAGTYQERVVVPELDGYALPKNLVPRLNSLRDQMPAQLQKPATQGLIARAQQFGVDPASAIAIFALENNYGGQAVSGAGARGSMQIMPETYKGVKAFFTNPKNKMPAALAQIATTFPIDANDASTDQLRDAGLLYLYQLQNVNKIPTNLLGAAYHAGGGYESFKRGVAPNVYDKAAKIWTPDHNAMYIGLYNNYVQLTGGQVPAGQPGTGSTAQQDLDGITTFLNSVNRGQAQADPIGAFLESRGRGQSGATTQDLTTAFPNTTAKLNAARTVVVDNTGKRLTLPETAEGQQGGAQVVPAAGQTTTQVATPAAAQVKDEALNQARRALTMTPEQHNYEVQKILRDRNLAVQSYNRGKADAYTVYQGEFENINARRQLLATQAEAARRVGNVKTAASFLDQINTLDGQLNQAKYRYLTAVNGLDGDIQTGLRAVDNNLSLAVAYQGLNDLKYRNDPTRIEQMWSQYSGSEVRIQPRTDGNYNLWVAVGGKLTPAGVYGAEDLSNKALENILPEWRQRLADAQSSIKSKLFEAQLDVWKTTQGEMAKTLGTLKVEDLKGNYGIITERIKNLGFADLKETQGPNGPMLVAVSKDGNAIMQIDINPVAADKDGTFKRESIRVLPNPARAGLATK